MIDATLKKVLDEQLHERLFDQVPVSIAVIDKDFDIVKANAHFENTFGTWRGRKCFEVYKGKPQLCPLCSASVAFRDGWARVSEEQGKDRDGNVVYYLQHTFPLKDETGDVPYLVEMSIDITDLRKVEQEYRLLFENVPCYVAVVDRDFRVLKTNRLFDDKFRKQGAAFCYEMYKGSRTPCADCPAAGVFQTGQVCQSLQAGVDKNGVASHYMVTAAPLLGGKDGVRQVIEMSLDVSEVLSLKERLRQAQKELIEKERLAAVGQTVAGLSHGIKNVLMGLEGGMYVVNSGLTHGDDDLVKRGWQMLENNITKVSTFVKEFLSFARGTEPDIQVVDPSDVAREIVELFRERVEQSGIEFVVDIPDSMEQAPMDPEGIHTCLANLLSNAIDACLMSETEDRKIALSCGEKDDTICYSVEDNGCGMDYEVKKKIFTSFFTTKGTGQGTGLGLLFTRKIVNQHGGDISVESAPAKGSVFTLTFPRCRLPGTDGSRQ